MKLPKVLVVSKFIFCKTGKIVLLITFKFLKSISSVHISIISGEKRCPIDFQQYLHYFLHS